MDDDREPLTAWSPQPGPQAAFVDCPVFECFFGGARGGGKTEAVIGEWALHAAQHGADAIGLMIRRTRVELDETFERAKSIYTKLGVHATYNPRRFVFPNGARITYAYLERDTDAESYQGWSTCVAVGTPIRMADGTLKAIDVIQRGEMVATLEGPRRVVDTTRPYLAACVRVSVRAASGECLGYQIHPVWHPVLTTSGLISSRKPPIRRTSGQYPDMTGARSFASAEPPPCVGQEIPAWFAYSSDEGSAYRASSGGGSAYAPPPGLTVPVVLHAPSFPSGQRHDRDCHETTMLCHSHGISDSGYRYLSRDRRTELMDRRRPGGHALSTPDLCVLSLGGERAYAPTGPRTEPDYPADYHAGRDCGDELVLYGRGSDRDEPPSPAGVAGQRHNQPMGASGTIPARNPSRSLSWVHPYTGEARGLVEGVSHGTMEVLELTKAWVADLTVESANHYISETGLINKNTRVYIEEAGNFPSPQPILKLMATLRSGAGVPVGIRLTGNPGGSGHQWLRSRYIDPAPLGWKILRDAAGLERIYIPSRVTDNAYLGSDYVQRLSASGSPELVRAWLHGDWTVVSGAFFPEFSAERHIMPPRALPEHWARFRSFDWGSARPFAVHWWAVSDGSLPDIARGCLVCYREWYGMKPGEPNVGLRMTAEQVAEGIRERERDDPKPRDGGMVGVADPSIFAEDGGPSIAMRMTRAARIIFRPGDNKRVPQRGAMGGWDQVRARLVGDADDNPMVVLFSTCVDLIRTLPAMQHDASRAEDIDTESEDHAVDSLRYAMMSRPYVRDMERPKVVDSWDAAFARDERPLRDWRVA